MASNTQKRLTAVKMGLEVLYGLGLIGSIALIIITGIALSNTTKETEQNKEELIVALVVAVLALLFFIIGIIGIVKENKCIVIILLIFVIIEIIAYFATKEYLSASYGIVIAVLTIAFIYLIVQKEKEPQPSA